MGLKVCVVTAWSVRLASGCFTFLIPMQALFIKTQINCHYSHPYLCPRKYVPKNENYVQKVNVNLRTQREKTILEMERIFIRFNYLSTKEISYEWKVQAHKILCVWDWRVYPSMHSPAWRLSPVGWKIMVSKTYSLVYASGRLVSSNLLSFKPQASILIHKHSINVRDSFISKGFGIKWEYDVKSCTSIFEKIFRS